MDGQSGRYDPCIGGCSLLDFFKFLGSLQVENIPSHTPDVCLVDVWKSSEESECESSIPEYPILSSSIAVQDSVSFLGKGAIEVMMV